MAGLNQVNLIGNLTRDVELKYTQAGLAVAEIGLAITDKVKRGDQWVDDTVFMEVVLFGRTAEVAGQYLAKGAAVYIGGRLKIDQWEQNGEKRSKLKVVGERMQMLGGKVKEEAAF